MSGTADRPRVLVIEDDADINEVVCAHLARRGYDATAARSGTEARAILKDMGAGEARFDAIVTDLMLPGVPGEALVAQLRAAGEGVPIIVISARAEVDDRVALLAMGADDYLVKPFDLNELTARIEAQLRARGYGRRGVADGDTAGAAGHDAEDDGNGRHVLTAGRWTIDEDAHTFAVDGEPVALTNLEFAIVALLAEHPNTVFTKQQLYELCWGEAWAGDDNTVTAHISKVRAKLKPTGTDGYVATVWGIGVKLKA